MNKLLVFAILLYSLTAVSAAASEDAEIIALEIRNLSTSVDRLTQFLYDQAQQTQPDEILRKLDIAVAYLNFRSRRIEMLERDKQNSQSIKTRLEDIIQRLATRIDQLEDENNEDATAKEANETTTNETLEQLKMLKQRLARVDEKLFDYDNQIIELRSQLDAVEGFVERHLEL